MFALVSFLSRHIFLINSFKGPFNALLKTKFNTEIKKKLKNQRRERQKSEEKKIIVMKTFEMIKNFVNLVYHRFRKQSVNILVAD